MSYKTCFDDKVYHDRNLDNDTGKYLMVPVSI